MSHALVSVITTFFNIEAFLADAIESVLAQTYKHWELVLVDDGSTDGSGAIAQRYAAAHPDRIRCIQHPGHENRGIPASRNAGVRSGAGSYVALLDGDDAWLPTKLERQVGILEQESRAAMVCGASLYWRSWTGHLDDIARDQAVDLGVAAPCLYEPPDLAMLLYPLGKAGAPCPSDLLIRRRIYDQLGGFEERFRGIYGLYEDQAFLMKLYLHHPVFVADELWDRYRLRPGSCMDEVVRDGHYHQVRGFFLAWLESYLSSQDIQSPVVAERLRAAMAASGQADTIADIMHLVPARWTLRLGEDNVARLLNVPNMPEVLRVEIDRCTPHPLHDIQLNYSRFRVSSGVSYTVRLRARADAPRQIAVGMAMADQPWDNVGLYEEFQIDHTWQSLQSRFTTTADTDSRLHIDLGGSAVALELGEVIVSAG